MSDTKPNGKRAAWLSPERLGAITDGVVAIIITILVLGIEVPKGHEFARDGTLAFLRQVEHEVIVYCLSFFLIGTFWLQHHVMFHYISRTNRTMIGLNGLFLFMLSLSPFTTALASEYRDVPLANVIFGLTYFLSGLTFFAMWRYCAAGNRHLRRPIDPAVARSMSRRILVAPALSLLGILVMSVNFHAGALVYISIPLFYARHWLIDSSWRGKDA